MDGVPSFHLSQDSLLEFHQAMAPTLESVRTSYLMELLLRQGKNVLLAGPTGTGKTAVVKDVLLHRLEK